MKFSVPKIILTVVVYALCPSTPTTSSGSTTDCDVTLSASQGSFISKGYPKDYPRDAYCTHTILLGTSPANVTINFSPFNMENDGKCSDYVLVDGKKLCNSGGRVIKVFSVQNSLTITLVSDDDEENTGFFAKYMVKPLPVIITTTTKATTTTIKEGTTSTVTTSTVNPSTATESTVNRSTVTESTVSPSTVTESTVNPSIVTEYTVNPSTVTQSTVKPSTVTESTVNPSTVTESTVRPSTVTELTVKPPIVTESTVNPSTVTESTVNPSTVAESTTKSTEIIFSTVKTSSTEHSTENGTMASTLLDSVPASITSTDAASTDAPLSSLLTQSTLLPHKTTKNTVEESVSLTTRNSAPTGTTPAPLEVLSTMTSLRVISKGTSGSMLQSTTNMSITKATINSVNTLAQSELEPEFIRVAPLEHVTKKLPGSIYDDRASSQTIGYIGIAFVAVPMFLIFVLDTRAIYNHIRMCLQNISGPKELPLIGV